jgi:processing peptidase subunit beta
VFDRLHEAAYRGQSLGRTILGPEVQIASGIKREMLKEYIKRHYTTDRIVVVGAGKNLKNIVF